MLLSCQNGRLFSLWVGPTSVHLLYEQLRFLLCTTHGREIQGREFSLLCLFRHWNLNQYGCKLENTQVNHQCNPVCLTVLRQYFFFYIGPAWCKVNFFWVQFYCLCKSSSSASGKLLLGALNASFLLGNFYDLVWLIIKSRHCGFTGINNITSLTSSGKWQVSAFQVNLKPVIHSDS